MKSFLKVKKQKDCSKVKKYHGAGPNLLNLFNKITNTINFLAFFSFFLKFFPPGSAY